jgi:prepilin-type processing-associated H-X9-DG protein
MANLHQISIADRMYLDDDKEVFTWELNAWTSALSPYLGVTDPDTSTPVFEQLPSVFVCPADEKNQDGPNAIPLFQWSDTRKISYPVNAYFFYEGSFVEPNMPWGFMSESILIHPSKTFYRADMYWTGIGTNFFWDTSTQKNVMRDEVDWHGDKVSMLYTDGHANIVSIDELLDKHPDWAVTGSLTGNR